MPLRSLAVAVCTGRVAAVFMEGRELIGWAMSRTAASSPQAAKRIVSKWIAGFGPDHLISEDPRTARHKGQHTQSLLHAIASLFADSAGLDIRVPRIQTYQNKYVEAAALAKRYPSIAHLCPSQPPIWQSEPRNLSYFEALSLVEQIRA